MTDPVDLRVVAEGRKHPGLDLPETIGPAEWREIGSGLARERRASDIEWRIGDWAARADGTFATLDEAAGLVGESLGNLKKYVATAKAYPKVRRRTGVLFSLHLEAVAVAEAERERLLDRAEAERWTRAEMREAVRESSQAGENARLRRENAQLKRTLRQLRADARDTADQARARCAAERRVIRDSLRRLRVVSGELAADGALDGLHGNARRGLARDLRRLADRLADDMDGAIADLGAAADIIEAAPEARGERGPA